MYIAQKLSTSTPKKLGTELGNIKPEEGCEDHTSEPYFCSVFIGQKAEANTYFHFAKAEDFKPSQATIALGTRQLDDFYPYLRDLENVKIAQELEDTEWGWRWFTVKDNDGNSLTFFKFLEGGNPGEE